MTQSSGAYRWFTVFWATCWLGLFVQGVTAAVPSLANPNVTKVSDRVYALIGDMDVPNEHNQGFICNSSFVITNSGVVVIDPGGSLQVGQMIIKEIRKRTSLPITHVLNSHHHADHWMGNHAFAGLTPKPLIMGHEFMVTTAADIGERWLQIIAEMTGGQNKGTQAVVPEKILRGDETLEIGGLQFVLFHPKHAHTRGDIAVLIPQEKVLIAGDILFYLRTPGFQDASPLGNAQALRELKKLDFDKVVPGHGPVTDKSGVDYMLSFINTLEQGVTQYLNEGLQDFEMKDKLDMGHFHNMSGFKERFGVTVNRMYLEVEAREFQ